MWLGSTGKGKISFNWNFFFVTGCFKIYWLQIWGYPPNAFHWKEISIYLRLEVYEVVLLGWLIMYKTINKLIRKPLLLPPPSLSPLFYSLSLVLFTIIASFFFSIKEVLEHYYFHHVWEQSVADFISSWCGRYEKRCKLNAVPSSSPLYLAGVEWLYY